MIMTTEGQGNSLTFVQGHSDSNFQTSFSKKTLGCLKLRGVIEKFFSFSDTEKSKDFK